MPYQLIQLHQSWCQKIHEVKKQAPEFSGRRKEVTVVWSNMSCSEEVLQLFER